MLCVFLYLFSLLSKYYVKKSVNQLIKNKRPYTLLVSVRNYSNNLVDGVQAGGWAITEFCSQHSVNKI